MKTVADYLNKVLNEEYLPQELQKKAKPFTVGKVSGHRLSINKNNEADVKQKIHDHLVSKGFKRNATLSEPKASTYEHKTNGQVHVTHTGNSITIEKENK